MNDASVDSRNIAFWDEMCGTTRAQTLGITGHDRDSLKRFDDWYMDYYYYLYRHIPFHEFRGQRVLEVGLGYGTVSELIAAAGARLVGLDIAAGPVEMVRLRLERKSLPGHVVQGSILNNGFADESFDSVVSIGCYHHTGDLARALEETRRLLVPHGKAYVMVYNAYSYKRWRRFFKPTLRYLLWDYFGISEPTIPNFEERKAYDANAEGIAAPETVFTSARRIKQMTAKWSGCKVFHENIDPGFVWKNWRRRSYTSVLGPLCGLDLYCHLVK